MRPVLKQIVFRLIAGALRLILRPRFAENPALFYELEKHGYHLTKVHFYSPIPNVAALDDAVWSRSSALGGIDMNTDTQVRLLAEVESRYKLEYDRFPLDREDAGEAFWINNGMFVSVDAEMLYCIVRSACPRRIIEIGCGFSTRISAAAIQANRGELAAYECELTCVDPYPPAWLNNEHAVSRLLRAPVQSLVEGLVKELEANDILFIDSSHVAAIGSDVICEVLELLPNLAPGVLVHFHDIFIPYEYPMDWVKAKGTFWNEQYLVQAFLAFNSAFEVVWAGHYMHRQYPARLAAAFRSYDAAVTMPASLWLRRKETHADDDNETRVTS
jgi:hypothetical protein